MKKFLSIFLIAIAFVLCTPKMDVSYAESNNVYIVTANSAVVFASPDFSSSKIATLPHKTEITLEMDETGAKIFSSGGFVFHKTETKFQFEEQEVSGYILADLVIPKSTMVVSIPNFNAKTNSQCKVFLKENFEFVESEVVLEKGERIFLYEGFKNKTEFTAIAFINDNVVKYGYLKTECINPDGINPVIITCGVVILAVLGIVFAWLFMKNKNKSIFKRKK